MPKFVKLTNIYSNMLPGDTKRFVNPEYIVDMCRKDKGTEIICVNCVSFVIETPEEILALIAELED